MYTTVVCTIFYPLFLNVYDLTADEDDSYLFDDYYCDFLDYSFESPSDTEGKITKETPNLKRKQDRRVQTGTLQSHCEFK